MAEMKECKTCYGYGLWGIGDPCPIGPIDASGGYPTIVCPECGANANPMEDKLKTDDTNETLQSN